MNGTEKNSNISHFGSLPFVGQLGKFKTASKKKTSDTSHFEVWTVDNKPILIDLSRLKLVRNKKDILVRDVVQQACKKIGIAPRTSAFFGISFENNWLIQTYKIEVVQQKHKHRKFILMLQFKVLLPNELRQFDAVAYHYYIRQCHYSFKSGLLAKYLEGKENEKILLRMVILEMMVVAKEANVSLKDVMKSKNKKLFSIEEILKKYNDKDGPRDVSKCKQKVEKSLNCFSKVKEPEKDFVTEVELLTQHREDVFNVKKYEGDRTINLEIWITPTEVLKRAIVGNVKMTLWQSPFAVFHKLKEEQDPKKEGKQIIILRGDEPPEMFYCDSEEQMESLFSFVDGYFQVLVNQYDSLLHDTCDFLKTGLSHSPIEREVALRILTSKGRERGTYLIREHTQEYDKYVLSLIKDDDNFSHLVINMEQQENGFVYKIDEKRTFKSLAEMQEFYKKEENSNEIKTCLKKCILPKNGGQVPLYTDPSNFRPPPPVRHNHNSLLQTQMVYPCLLDTSKMEDKLPIKNGIFGDVWKCKTEIRGDKKELLIKRYTNLKNEMLTEIASVLMQIQSHERILDFVGTPITKDLSLAFEFLPLGSMDQYLDLHRSEITYGQLLKYMYQITDAVVFLHNSDLIHADLRLSKFLLKSPNDIKLSDSCITWKLANFKKLDKTIFQKRYKFLAPEIFLEENQEFTKMTDTWSYGLTIWQLFTLLRPFKNCSSTDLRNYFREHIRIPQQPALIHLNMNILRFCPEGLFSIYSQSLAMRPEDRYSIDKLFRLVVDLKKKAPTYHKEQLYFVYDWDTDEALKDRRKKPLPNDYQSYGSDDSFAIGQSGYDGPYHTSDVTDCSGDSIDSLRQSIKLENTTEDDGIEIVDRSFQSSPINPSPSNMSCTSASETTCAVSAPSPVQSDIITSRSNSDEKMDVDVTSIPSVPISLASNTVGSSHSAPSSPSRPKIFRSTSASNEKRGEEDLETASILVGMAQTHNKTNLSGVNKQPPSSIVPSFQGQQRQPVFCVPKGFSIVGPIRQPVRFVSQHPGQAAANTPPKLLQRTLPQSAESTQSKKDYPSRSPQPPPPDSPDSTRRDLPEPPRREVPRDDKTRLYLQEKINKERDRYRGKRSLSFHEEFDEYKNNTRKAAKRALLGSNPFNLGVQVPTNFLLSSDKRPYPTVGADIVKFFNSSIEKPKVSNEQGPPPKLLTNGKHSKSTSLDPYKSLADLEMSRGMSRGYQTLTVENPSSQHQGSLPLDPYKTAEDLKKYRQTALMKASDENRKQSGNDIQSVVRGIKDMHAHSPKDNFDDNRRLPQDNRRVFVPESSRPVESSVSSAPVTTTVNVFSTHPAHGISSIFMPLQQVRFPYGHPTDPSQIPYSLPPTSLPGVRSSKKNLASGYSTGYILPMHVQQHPDRPRLASAVPILTMNAGPYIRPRIPVSHSKFLSAPPNLPRFTSNPGLIYTSEHPRLPAADQPYSPIQTVRSSEIPPLPSSAFKQLEKSKAESTGPKIESVISFGVGSAIVKKEVEDSSYTSMQKAVGGADCKEGPVAPGGLFGSCEPNLFKTSLPRMASKKQILKKDLIYNRKKDLLGKGQFGAVYKGVWVFTNPITKCKKEVDVAVKTVHNDNPLTDEALEDLRKEADAMAILTSENISEGAKHIIKMYGICADPNDESKFSIVSERAQGGALDTYLFKNKATLGENGVGYCLFYGKQIATGMEYLHNQKIIHRDLACRNILVMQKELVKISDFGLSRIFTDTNYYRSKRERKVPLPWMAIESIGEWKYTLETDYWSYGVTLWEMFTVLDKDYPKHSVLPYEAEGVRSAELFDYLTSGKRLSKPKLCPQTLWNNVILKCWNKEPKKRPSFYLNGQELLKMMNEIDFCLGQ